MRCPYAAPRDDAPGDVSDYMVGMIRGQALDQHGARIGIQGDGKLRIYALRGPYGRWVAGTFGLNQPMAGNASWVG